MVGAANGFWNNFGQALWDSVPNANDLAHFVIRSVQVIVVLAVTLFLAQRVKGWVARLLGRSRIDPNILALAGNGVFLLVSLLGVFSLLGLFGANWTAILASLSVVTVAIGLAVQDVLKNLVSGVYLLLERPFKIGDQIALRTVAGKVEGIDIRTTVLRTEDGVQVLVPNTIVFSEIVTNQSAYDARRVSLQLTGVQASYQELHQLVSDALEPFDEIANTPAPKVLIQKVEAGALTLTVEFWSRNGNTQLPAILSRLQDVFPDAQIMITANPGA
ncbi:MAG TPA: mechanosensitive ion channel domain-containing protein [Thermomicrobiales bacterium]|jgi:small conductance mechanosensitive channel|nr:mechanosensitive ion channel domain-containing protein [Thermomicrobiales bacterium]